MKAIVCKLKTSETTENIKLTLSYKFTIGKEDMFIHLHIMVQIIFAYDEPLQQQGMDKHSGQDIAFSLYREIFKSVEY